MPLYEYACQACEHRFETLVRGGELPECPSCHGTHLEKKQSTMSQPPPAAAIAATREDRGRAL